MLAYLNGQEVHRNDCQRAYTADLDEISVSLKAGWNTLVFRVTQAELAWSVSARFTTTSHKPLPLKFSSKRPSGPEFKGFVGRRNGVRLSSVPRVELAAPVRVSQTPAARAFASTSR